MRPTSRPVVLALVLLTCLAAPRAQGTPIGFSEQFALAEDRQAVLDLLIPGSEDYYFYSCLERQQAGAFGDVAPLLRSWIERHGRNARVEEIENRQALLTFERSPAATYAFLRERLGLRFDAERQSAGAVPDLPTRLDPSVLSMATLTGRALAAHPGTIDGFRASAFEALAKSDLSDELLMSLMRRLSRPDVANLPALVVRNLRHRQSRGFGSLPIHRNLLLDQLDEVVRLQPAVLDETAFVDVYLRRLAPNPDVEWQRDPAAREAHLRQLWAFAQRLSSSHNSLKAHVLYRWLSADLSSGAPNKQRFLQYLRLPRQTAYVNPDYLRRRARGDEVVNAGSSFPTGFDAIGNDEPLVRAYLQHFFASEDSYQPYVEFVQEAYLKRLFAETRILMGVGDMEEWYSMLDPVYVEQLKQRVEIAFLPTQKTWYGPREAVGVDVDLKNVDKLLVKVFVIDTFDFERDTGAEVDASIDLDGMVANEEKVYTYTDNPLRRVRRHFDFPALTEPGTYVVEFLGNGLSSRAVIKKGRLQYVSRTGSAGQVLTVLDENGDVVTNASAWCGGQEYAADDDGDIYVPFAPGRVQQPLILRHGNLTSLHAFDHLDESYALAAAVFVDREALLAPFRAKVLVRPTLMLQGEPVALSLLEQPELEITSRDQDGVESSVTVRDLELTSNAELVYEIAVPTRLTKLTAVLRGKVKSVSQGVDVALTSRAVSFDLNGIEATTEMRSPLLGRSENGWFLDVLGKNGEPRPEVAVHLTLTHRDFTDAIEVDLKTGARGRIDLGSLPGITTMSSPQAHGTWRLREADCRFASVLTGTVGSVLRVPYQGAASRVDRAAVSLLEVIGETFVRDALQYVAIAGGFVELRELPAGDYDLWLKEADQHIAVRVTAGAVRDGWVVGADRMLQLSGQSPLQVAALRVAGEELQIQLANVDPATRVHVFATRWVEPFDPFADLWAPPAPSGAIAAVTHPESTYHAGRQISDEYRYILDRRYQKKYPGNMLRRPGLILNPWEIDQSETAVGLAGGGGGRFGGRGGAAGPRGPSTPGPSGGISGQAPGEFANIDFLPMPAPMLANLRADAQGIVRVALADLGQGQLVHVVAVNERDTVYTTLALPEQPLTPRSRTLKGGLDPARHFTEQRRLEFLTTGAKAQIDDVTTSTVESYGSLSEVFQLLQTLSGNGELAQFEFLMRWPQLTGTEKLEQYSQHACHEVNLFLYEKDRAFFDAVIGPYLANKADKTFVDHWLLQDDLADYLEPWAFEQLNVVEKILLTARLPGQRDAGARRVRESYDLRPVDQQLEARLFATALAGRALEADRDAAKLGLDALRRLAANEPSAEEDEAVAKAPAEAPSPDSRVARERAAGEKVVAHLEEQDTTGSDEFFMGGARKNKDVERRKQARQLYRPPGRTLEYAENNYWHVPIARQNADLIEVNGFWSDFALAPIGAPFCSTHIAEATSSLSEMLLALAVIDLPFEAEAPGRVLDGNSVAVTAKTPLLLVRKEIRPAGASVAESPVLISQNFYRLDERYRYEGNERLDNFVTGELLIDVAYGCQIVLTNPTSTPRKLDLLLQVPRGSLPVNDGFYTRGVTVQLQPFATASFEYAFYFPAAGDFPHYPAHVAKDGALVAFAPAVTLHVVVTPTAVDTTSWEHVSQDADPAAVLTFLDQQNLQRLDLAKIAWRMRDAAFFETVIEKLRQRFSYNDTLWSYGVLHQNEATARDYLSHQGWFIARCGRALASRLLTIDPVERRSYQRIEFDPLFHARVHRFGRQRVILNSDQAQQYLTLLDILCYTPRLEGGDWMSVTYHLLLQDRIDEGLGAFAKVDAAALPTKLQYDYVRCYLDFFTDEHRLARRIAEPYRDHRVTRWRQMFRDVLNQLDEAEGKAVAVSDRDDRTQRQTELAATEPGLALAVEAKQVTVRYQNLTECRVSYYELDVEFSFSTNPFVQQGSGAFAYVRPNRSDVVSLPPGEKQLTFDLPQDYRQANVMIEVSAAGITRRQTYLSNTLATQMVESYGQMQVTQAGTGKLLPRVYVKVYARLADGAVRFHKDGYTDLRGRFDYVSVSEQGTEGAERFAVLVLSESDGALIREVAPPGQ